MPLPRLRALREAIAAQSRAGRPQTRRYAIPSVWADPSVPPAPRPVDPFAFYLDALDAILSAPPVPPHGAEGSVRGGWSRSAVVYNLMVRLTCAYDHDGDGELGLPLNSDGWRETGTFLKAIAILPYVRSLGVNTVHLLPVQEIGFDGRRGGLGSPYAVRNPRALDPMLGEPLIGLSVEEQFSAFVEAAHHSGLRIILELPLRTQSKDCVWAEVNPDWFYWIRGGADFHPPAFTPEQVRRANELIGHGVYDGLPAPTTAYRGLFTDPPDRSTVRLEGGRWVGTVPGCGDVVIPGAFADWPPDDHQPVWADVTYLKFYQDERYNYPSYNTVRMYDSTLLGGGTESAGLWDELVALVSWYAREFRIDGMMVDMAHAIPDRLAGRIIAGARHVNPSFAFWAEDFSRTPDQVSLGYDAVLGGQWACQHRRKDFRDMLAWLGRTPELLPHLAAPETHNTPRAAAREGGESYSRYAWAISCFLPGIPYIHSGFESGDTHPVNTGLGFNPEELAQFPADALPLFSARALRWERGTETRKWVAGALRVRKYFEDCIVPAGASFRIVESGDDRVIAFVRSSPDGRRSILVAANSEPSARVSFRIPDVPAGLSGKDHLSGGNFHIGHGILEGTLEPGQVAVFAAGKD